VPYRMPAHSDLFGERVVGDVIAYLRLAHNPSDRAALGRVADRPRRGLGRLQATLVAEPTTVAELPALASQFEAQVTAAAATRTALVYQLHASDFVDIQRWSWSTTCWMRVATAPGWNGVLTGLSNSRSSAGAGRWPLWLRGRLRPCHPVPSDRAVGHHDPEVEQFTSDSLGAPESVLTRRGRDQLSHFGAEVWASAAGAGRPTPEHTPALLMPAHDRSGVTTVRSSRRPAQNRRASTYRSLSQVRSVGPLPLACISSRPMALPVVSASRH
jgi:hypothetical protein